MSHAPLLLVGAHGSPYSRKLRALLRYRRIPFRWIVRGSAEDRGVPDVPVALIPVLVFPTGDGRGEAGIDSTPLIRRLEAAFPGRSAIPPDPALALLDALLEDYADEWVTKAMFHYRWAFPPDVDRASRLLPLDRDLTIPPEALARFGAQFAARQIGRLGVVGSNQTTAPVIEASYRRLLGLLDALLRERAFLFGGRPASADFALFGQLSQLAAFDPTSAAIALAEAPRVVAWVQHADDLSGSEVGDADWLAADALGAPLRALLEEVGRVYAPFVLANAEALARGDERVSCTIDGRSWQQRPFPYQSKCLRALREHRAALAPGDRARADALLAGTGCEVLFA